MRKICSLMAVALAALPVGLVQADDNEVTEELRPYERARGISGSLRSIGSDTMNNLMALWAEEFERFYPNVRVEIEGKGSSTAPAALIEGQAQFGPMSREMRSSESDAFENRFGYPPTLLRTGIDALAVYVHKDAPLDEITIDQVTEVFSVAGRDMTWGDLGVEDSAWRNRPIALYGRNSASGTYGYFQSVALQGNDYKSSVREQPGSSAVVQAVSRDRYAMGYSGIGYRTANVKPLAISEAEGFPAVLPTPETAYSGDYPLARFLYVYINFDEREGLDPLQAEFIRLIYSREGQEAVARDGYIPLTRQIADSELRDLGLLDADR